MTTSEPFVPHPDDDRERIAAADPGVGAPAPADGFGVEGEEPGDAADEERSVERDAGTRDDDTPFRTPQPPAS